MGGTEDRGLNFMLCSSAFVWYESLDLSHLDDNEEECEQYCEKLNQSIKSQEFSEKSKCEQKEMILRKRVIDFVFK